MNAHRHSLQITLATAAAALVLGVAQFAAIDRLAAPRESVASPMQIVQLPPVVVHADLLQPVGEVAQLPRVVVVGKSERATIQARADATAATPI